MAEIDRWHSVVEIASHLGVSKETVYRWVESRKIPSHRLGKLWKFKINEVDEWVKSGKADEATSQPEGQTEENLKCN